MFTGNSTDKLDANSTLDCSDDEEISTSKSPTLSLKHMKDSAYVFVSPMWGPKQVKNPERELDTERSGTYKPKMALKDPQSTCGKPKVTLRPAPFHLYAPELSSVNANSDFYHGCADDGPVSTVEDPACVANDDALSVHVAAQNPQTVTMRTAHDIDIASHNVDMETGSNSGELSRSPSPWQAELRAEAVHTMARLLWWAAHGLNDDMTSSTNSSPETFETESPVIVSIERAKICTAGAGSGTTPVSTAGPAKPNPNTDACRSGPSGLKRTRGSYDPTRGSDDGEENESNRKQLKAITPAETSLRPRFACPYQKYDPRGSPWCCMQSIKNPVGGADSFGRVK